MDELKDLEETVAATQEVEVVLESEEPPPLDEPAGAGDAVPEAEVQEESSLLGEEPISLEESEDSLREAATEMGLDEPAFTPAPGLGADSTAILLDNEQDELPLPIEDDEPPNLVDAIAAEGIGGEEPDALESEEKVLELDEAGAGLELDFAEEETGEALQLEPLPPEEEPLELGEVGEELEFDAAGDEESGAEELAAEDISEYIEDDFSDTEFLAEAEVELEAAETSEEEDDDFASAFAELQEEISANPEGERLTDVLEREGIKAAVNELEFPVAEEDNLSRAMGISQLPGEATMDEPSAGASPEAEPRPAPAAEAPRETPALGFGDTLLDENIKAKLEAVLDEIITVSVRRAVQEEMPKLMEQMMKDNRPA